MMDEAKPKINMKKAREIRDKYVDQVDEGLNNYIIVYQDGEVMPMLGEACYSDLKYDDFVPHKDVEFLIDYPCFPYFEGSTLNILDGNTNRYVDWVINRSPFSSVFITKSAHTGMKKGFIIRGDLPSNLTVAGMIAIRHTYEYPAVIRLWGEFTKAGMDENFAFMLSNNTGLWLEHKAFTFGGALTGHNAVINKFIPKYWANFINNKPEYLQEDWTGGINYGSMESIWYDNDLYFAKVPELPEYFNDHKIKVKEWGRMKEYTGWKFSDLPEFIEKCVPWYYKEMEKFL